MGFRKDQVTRPIAYLTNMKRILRDILGAFPFKGMEADG